MPHKSLLHFLSKGASIWPVETSYCTAVVSRSSCEFEHNNKIFFPPKLASCYHGSSYSLQSIVSFPGKVTWSGNLSFWCWPVINSECSIATLKTSKQWWRRVWKYKKNILLQHDFARPHTFWTTVEAIEKLDLTILPHLSQSPDFMLCDFHLFPKMREDIRGHRCDSNEELERTVRTWLKKQNVEFLHGGFEKLVRHWRNCVKQGGDYVEK
jgi:hypothetical protein